MKENIEAEEINKHLKALSNELIGAYQKYMTVNKIFDEKIFELALLNLVSSVILYKNVTYKTPIDKKLSFITKSLRTMIKDKLSQGEK